MCGFRTNEWVQRRVVFGQMNGVERWVVLGQMNGVERWVVLGQMNGVERGVVLGQVNLVEIIKRKENFTQCLLNYSNCSYC